MPARRTFAHGPQGGWSAIALHLETAEAPKEGFYLTLFPDGRQPAVVFLRAQQMQQLLDLAAREEVGDPAVWDYVAKIPLEPLLPSRGLAARLRALLADHGAALREQVRVQRERQPPPPLDESATAESETSAATVAPSIDDPYRSQS
jgi:hypothetical protein